MSANLNQKVRVATTWSIVLGVLIILAGLLAILLPLVTSVAVVFILGWVFLISGVFRAVQAIQNQLERGFWMKLVVSVIYAVIGLLILTNLASGLVSLRLIIGLTVLVNGILEIILAFQIRPMNGWQWTLLSGFVSLVLGTLICFKLAAGVVWIISLMVGISLILTGLWFIMLSLAVRNVPN
ncbi:MAG: HdeD family acid-resistance protein [Thainema sp.]